jgi:hypothetical protein
VFKFRDRQDLKENEDMGKRMTYCKNSHSKSDNNFDRDKPKCDFGYTRYQEVYNGTRTGFIEKSNRKEKQEENEQIRQAEQWHELHLVLAAAGPEREDWSRRSPSSSTASKRG